MPTSSIIESVIALAMLPRSNSVLFVRMLDVLAAGAILTQAKEAEHEEWHEDQV